MYNNEFIGLCVNNGEEDKIIGFSPMIFYEYFDNAVEISAVAFASLTKFSSKCTKDKPTILDLSNKQTMEGFCKANRLSQRTVIKNLNQLVSWGMLFETKQRRVYIVNHYFYGIGTLNNVKKWQKAFMKKDGIWYYNEVKDNV